VFGLVLQDTKVVKKRLSDYYYLLFSLLLTSTTLKGHIDAWVWAKNRVADLKN